MLLILAFFQTVLQFLRSFRFLNPSLSKIFKKTIHRQLEKFLYENGIIHSNQFGFVIMSSVLAAYTQLINFFEADIDRKFIFGCVLIDISKSFDILQHASYYSRRLKETESQANTTNNFLLFFFIKICDYLERNTSCPSYITAGLWWTRYEPRTFTVCVLHCCSFGRSKLQARSTKTKFLLTIVIKFEANCLCDSAIERRRSLSVAMFCFVRTCTHIPTCTKAKRLLHAVKW